MDDTAAVTDGGLSYVHALDGVPCGGPAVALCGRLIGDPVPHGVKSAGVWCPACTRAGLERIALGVN